MSRITPRRQPCGHDQREPTMRSRARSVVRPATALTLASICVLSLSTVVVAGASGENYRVTKTADTADGSCSQQDCSLREAVIAANATPFEDTITLPAGTYTLPRDGPGENQSQTGDLDIRAAVTIRGSGARKTTIDGGRLDRVLHLPDQSAYTPFKVAVRRLTVAHGKSRPGQGGGIAI